MILEVPPEKLDVKLNGRICCKVPWKGYLKNLEYPVHEKVKFSTFAPS